MKKIFAVVLVLCFALSAVTAFAETRTFFMTGVQDPEGNVVSYVDNPDFPVLVFSVDDESMVCAFGTEDDLITGTCSVAEDAETTLALNVSLENGDEYTLIYVKAEDAFAFVDASGYIYVLANVNTLETEQAA